MLKQLRNAALYSLFIVSAVLSYFYDWERSDDCYLIKAGLWRALYPEEAQVFFQNRYCVGLLFERDKPRIPPAYLVFKMRGGSGNGIY